MARSSAAHLARRATGVASFAVGRQQGNAACARCAKLRTIAPPSASVRHGQEAIGSGVGRFRECAGLGMSVRSKRQRETRMRSRTSEPISPLTQVSTSCPNPHPQLTCALSPLAIIPDP